MGIQLTALVEGKEIELSALSGKKIAIDSFNWIYQFLSTIRQQDGTPLKDSKGNVTSHLSGLFYRTTKLMSIGVRPIYVFDGKMPELKRATAEQRRDVRAEAAREWKAALERGNLVEARKHAQRSSVLTEEMIRDSKKLLHALGVPALQAPSEGEALCSLIAKNGDAYAAATQDYDSLLFGCPRLIRNLSITGKRRRGKDLITVEPEMILLKDVLEKLGIGLNQLIILGILVGTDYNPGGVSGYGPKKALELVKRKKTLNAVLEEVVWDFDVQAQEIYDFFEKPFEVDYEIKFDDIDEEALKRLLCDDHDFSEERVDSAIEKLREQKSKDQKDLSKWF